MSWKTQKDKRGFGGGAAARAEAIAAFWTFWPTVSRRIAEGVVSSGVDAETVEAMSRHVRAIDARLDWELGPGRVAAHHLCLSGKGDPVLRAIAERWRKDAPPADATWEYYAARQPHGSGNLSLEIGGRKLELDALVCAITEDTDREKLDLVVHHPAYADIDEEELKGQIMFIALDTLLGEDDVERWVGALEMSDAAPEGAVPLSELPGRIAVFAPKCTGDRWALLQGKKDGAPIFVAKNTALKRIDHLLLDTHLEVAISFTKPDESGLPDKAELEALDALGDELITALGDDAVYVGRETHAGRRTLHLHVMEGGPSAAKVAAWRERHPEWRVETSVRPDPRWEILDRWG